ncbi:DUF4276 family protein [Stenotrophomonas panacihumi]|uniref:DUF4276 family protein n=1 Tax=Stenotrophomonas panacihumi TaxID=676599 RepID=UPI0009D687EA|nr:DUF4276 family protein [Stenotrophomonas panacihumi]PTN56241.1 DUF4276 domain-containing protein [Stenotrophomonas panacihumi]
MNIAVASIVEGHGEQAAFPVLLRRIFEWLSPGEYVHVPAPIRVHKDRFLNRDAEFSRYLSLADAKSDGSGWVMILLDADDQCPRYLGAEVLGRAQQALPGRSISVIIANREYEAWFIASARSLDGVRSFKFQGDCQDPEAPRDAKGWMEARMDSGCYGEVMDQPAFSAKLDLQQAHDRSRSFRKLVSECEKKLRAIRGY